MLSKISNIFIKDIVSSIPKISNFDNIKINSELKRTIDLIGVKQSYKTDNDTTTLDLCLNSARHLLMKSKIESSKIEIVVFVTQTPDYLMPSCSNIVHELLDLKKSCICFDINMGCSGYVYGLWNIVTLMESNKFKNGLLLVGDTISKTIKKNDRAHQILFGDAGTATLLGYKSKEVMHFNLGSDGKGSDKLVLKNSAFRNNKVINPEFYMDGKEVFLFAISSVPKITRELIDFSKIKLNEIRYYIFHQANLFMLNKIFDFLKLEKNNRLFSIKQYGNTSSASIPVTLCKHYKKTSNLNERVLISGFGAGFSYASGIINLKETKIHKILNYEKK